MADEVRGQVSISLPKGTGYPPVYAQEDGTFIAASKSGKQEGHVIRRINGLICDQHGAVYVNDGRWNDGGRYCWALRMVAAGNYVAIQDEGGK